MPDKTDIRTELRTWALANTRRNAKHCKAILGTRYQAQVGKCDTMGSFVLLNIYQKLGHTWQHKTKQNKTSISININLLPLIGNSQKTKEQASGTDAAACSLCIWMLNAILPSLSRSSKWCLSKRFLSTKNLQTFLLSGSKLLVQCTVSSLVSHS